jgi:DNA-3-methyladenine glycosylase
MFGPAGHAYVYRIYGVHWCLNVVTGEVGYPAAVLVRALDPVGGIPTMIERRNGKNPLCSGPGRLAQALGVSGNLDGHNLEEEPLELRTAWEIVDEEVGVSGRIGVGKASDWPLRFFLKGHPEVSGRPR